MLELLDHLQLQRAAVIGFSMGGLIARAFALHFPERLDALVVLNSVFNRSAQQHAGGIERTAQAAEHDPDANAEAALSRWLSRECVGQSTAGQTPRPSSSASCGVNMKWVTMRFWSGKSRT